MWSTERTIAAGDTIIVWMTRDSLEPLVVTPDAVLHNKFGVYPHNSLIGLPYGSKVQSSSSTGRGFLYVLRPTPELWTLALPHRTQILYLADISFVINWLNIGKGRRVVEAGTGSGSFSHSAARSIGETGKLFTFEFHEQRAIKAKEEFVKHGLSGIVHLQHRNVCKEGFGDDLEDSIDAVFLDLPAPWEAVPHAKKILRKDNVARICCFSPCIEQVIRTVSALNDAGFSEITMYETLLRPIEVSSNPQLPSIGEASERLKKAEVKREDKRQKQILANREKEAKDKVAAAPNDPSESTSSTLTGEKRKEHPGDSVHDSDNNTELVESKRAKTGITSDSEDAMVIDPTTSAVSPVPVTVLSTLASTSSTSSSNANIGKASVSKALPEVRGHTSYLTFAVLVPYAHTQKSLDHSSLISETSDHAHAQVDSKGSSSTSKGVSGSAEPLQKTDVAADGESGMNGKLEEEAVVVKEAGIDAQ